MPLMNTSDIQDMANLIRKYYPQFNDILDNLSYITLGKMAFGGALTTLDNEQLLKNPYSLENKRLAFNFMMAVFLIEQEKTHINLAQLILANKASAELFYNKNSSSMGWIDQDVQYAEQLQQTNLAKMSAIQQDALLLERLYKADETYAQALFSLEKEEKDDFDQYLQHNPSFTAEEKQRYQLTPEKQAKLHQAYQETQENMTKLAKMLPDKPLTEFNQGRNPQLEIKSLAIVTNLDKNNNLRPSEVKKLSGGFGKIVSHEARINPVYQARLNNNALIKQTEQKITGNVKKINDNNNVIGIFHDPKSFSLNIKDKDEHKKLTQLHEKLEKLFDAGNDNQNENVLSRFELQTKFEHRLTHMVRRLPEDEKEELLEKLYALKNALNEKDAHDSLPEKSSHILSGLNNVFEEAFPHFSPPEGSSKRMQYVPK